MWRLLADENFNRDILRGLALWQPDLDIVRVQDVGLDGVDDPEILAWAAANNRILLTHDRATMAVYACERLTAGEALSGVFILPDRLLVGKAIQELMLMVACSEPNEWNGRVIHIPL